MKLTGSGGEVRVRGVRAPITAETTSTTLILSPGAAVPITAATENDRIELTLPDGGVVLEAKATNGDIEAPEGVVTIERHDDLVAAHGRIRGGGPLVSLRTTRGDIVVR